MTKPHEYYMSQALELAREAADAGEVPVGCVIVRDGAVIGRGRNRREEKQAVSSHAEMEAMAQAKAMHDRLEALYNPYVDFDLVEETARQIGDEILNG